MHRPSSGEVKFTSLTDAVDVRTREAPRTSAMAFLLARRWRPLASLVSRGTCLGREAATWDGGMPVAMGNALSDVWKRGFTNVVQGAIPSQGVLALNQLWDNPGSMKKSKRVGRGIGSGKGKTCGRGHKGQKARSGGKPKLGFEGGQTPLRQRIPKRGFKNPSSRVYQLVNLSKLQEWIERGKIDPDQTITMKILRDTGCISKKILDGVKVLSEGADSFEHKVNLEVSAIGKKAEAAITKAGGQVSKVYYNKLGMRALLKPHALVKKEHFIPRPAQPPPYLRDRFDRLGEIPGAGELSTIFYKQSGKEE